MLPNFLVVGAQKSGSTSLHEYLRVSPSVYLPEQKETKFFLFNDVYAKGMGYYEDRFFGAWKGEPAIGEVDPDYMYFKQCLDRIKNNLDMDKLKLIFIFRNPVDRAFSHYLMTYRRGYEELSFEDALEAESSRIVKDDIHRMHYSYSDRGFYSRQLQRFMEVVEPTRMLFLLSDDLARNPAREVTRCLNFLGIAQDTDMALPKGKFHQAAVPRSTQLVRLIKTEGWHKKLVRSLLPAENFRLGLRAKMLVWNEKSGKDLAVSPELRKKLLSDYREDILSLQEMTGLELGHWFSKAQQNT